MSSKFVVQVFECEAEQPIKEIPAESQRQAERIERGLNTNLNHKRYYTALKATP